MTWVRIDDEFEDNAKVAPLSDGAHRVWMMANCWCKKPKNFHTHGFVPAAMLPQITRNRYNPKQLRNHVDELVNANVGGTKEHGLWEPVDGGWQFHDWESYLSKEDLELLASGHPKLSRSEAGRLGGQRSVESRRQSNGTARPKQPSKQDPKQNESASNVLPKQTSKHPRTPDPVPDPKSSDRLIQRPESPSRTDLQTRAAAALKDPYDPESTWACQWPEVHAVAESFGEVYGASHAKRGPLPQDSGVKAILALFASGHSLESVLKAINLSKSDQYCQAKVKGLSQFTLEVVNQLLSEWINTPRRPDAKGIDEIEAEARAAIQRDRQREAEARGRGDGAPPVSKTRPGATSAISTNLFKTFPDDKPKEQPRRPMTAEEINAAIGESNASP